jgi:hypothetical protein
MRHRTVDTNSSINRVQLNRIALNGESYRFHEFLDSSELVEGHVVQLLHDHVQAEILAPASHLLVNILFQTHVARVRQLPCRVVPLFAVTGCDGSGTGKIINSWDSSTQRCRVGCLSVTTVGERRQVLGGHLVLSNFTIVWYLSTSLKI